MSIKEKLRQIQTEGEGLGNRIDQKSKLAELKHQLAQSGLIVTKTRPQEMVLDTGLLDILSEAVDCIPFVQVEIQPQTEQLNFAIFFDWEDKRENSYKKLGVVTQADNSIYIFSSRPTPQENIYFSDSLKPQQWQDRERLESSIADALWMAGVRPIGGQTI